MHTSSPNHGESHESAAPRHPHQTPAQAWAALQAGNTRFVEGRPRLRLDRPAALAELAAGQHPRAVIFGCSDSRVAAEIIFDQSLGEIFVVRTAGHVIGTTVLGSLEYAVDHLGVPLVVVLGHDHCGAVTLAEHILATGEHATGYLGELAERIIPGIIDAAPAGPDPAGIAHVRYTARALAQRSSVLASAVGEGRCVIVGLEYHLAQGAVNLVCSIDSTGEARPNGE